MRLRVPGALHGGRRPQGTRLPEVQEQQPAADQEEGRLALGRSAGDAVLEIHDGPNVTSGGVWWPAARETRMALSIPSSGLPREGAPGGLDLRTHNGWRRVGLPRRAGTSTVGCPGDRTRWEWPLVMDAVAVGRRCGSRDPRWPERDLGWSLVAGGARNPHGSLEADLGPPSGGRTRGLGPSDSQRVAPGRAPTARRDEHRGMSR